MTHVPYKGAGPALIDLAAGQIDVMISNYSSLVPQMKVRQGARHRRDLAQAEPCLPRPAAGSGRGPGLRGWTSG
jgi:hypothetical protein